MHTITIAPRQYSNNHLNKSTANFIKVYIDKIIINILIKNQNILPPPNDYYISFIIIIYNQEAKLFQIELQLYLKYSLRFFIVCFK